VQAEDRQRSPAREGTALPRRAAARKVAVVFILKLMNRKRMEEDSLVIEMNGLSSWFGNHSICPRAVAAFIDFSVSAETILFML
jgi:hypothetical protein